MRLVLVMILAACHGGGGGGGMSDGGGNAMPGQLTVMFTQGSSNADLSAWPANTVCKALFSVSTTSFAGSDPNTAGTRRELCMSFRGKPMDGQTLSFGVGGTNLGLSETPVAGQGSGLWASTGGTATLAMSGTHGTLHATNVQMGPDPAFAGRAMGTFTIGDFTCDSDVAGL
jgi:hypothetical protein